MKGYDWVTTIVFSFNLGLFESYIKLCFYTLYMIFFELFLYQRIFLAMANSHPSYVFLYNINVCVTAAIWVIYLAQSSLHIFVNARKNRIFRVSSGWWKCVLSILSFVICECLFVFSVQRPCLMQIKAFAINALLEISEKLHSYGTVKSIL